MKNKCLKLFVLPIFILTGFFFTKPVKAAISVDNYFFMSDPNNWTQNFTVGTCDNRVLLAIYATYDDTAVNSLSYGGVAMTQIHDGGYSYHHGHYRMFILTNPASGTHNFVVNAGWDIASWGVVSLCGVDQTTPIANAQYFDNVYNSNFTTTLPEGNSVFGIGYVNFGGGDFGTYSYTQGTILNHVEQSWTGVALYTAQTSNNYLAHNFSSGNGMYKDYGFIAFNSGTPLTYCGDTLCQTADENCSTCPVDCGECAGNPNSGDSLGLFFFSNPYTFSNQSTAIVRYLYNENIFTPYDHIEIREISPDWATSTFIATSTIIDSTGFFSSKSNGNSYFTLTGNASTTGYVHYEVIGHLAAYWSPTLGDVEATTTIPYVVTVNWQPTQIPTVADILAASSTNPFYDDAVMYEAACSEEDWNTPPPEIFGVDVPALNLTVIGCKFKLGFIIAGNKFTSLATDGIYKAGNILKNVFPFNIYTNLNDSWKASVNSTVITELYFLSPIDGNLTAQIPTTGTSTATIVLWGKDIFTSSSTLGTVNAQKTNQLFLAIKTIIKWALWGLFGLWAIKNGKAFIEKMTGGE